jgi:hypothetical protein
MVHTTEAYGCKSEQDDKVQARGANRTTEQANSAGDDADAIKKLECPFLRYYPAKYSNWTSCDTRNGWPTVQGVE